MKSRILVSFLMLIISTWNCNAQSNEKHPITNADSLIANIAEHNNKYIVTEGYIAHICGVDGKKMKLKTSTGKVIKLIATHSLEKLNKSFYKKTVRVEGIAEETQIKMNYVEKLQKDKSVLCHIDHTPCKDSAWVNNHKRTGYADTLSAKSTQKLFNKIEHSENGYISLVTIYVESISIIDE